MKLPLKVILLFITCISYAQSQNSSKNSTRLVEEYIINNQLDSAAFFIEKIENKSYKELLSNIIKGKATYKDYGKFTSTVAEKSYLNYKLISDFINQNVEEPKNKKKINSEFVFLKWVQISSLRDEVSLEDASNEQRKLEIYINQFNPKDVEVLREKTRIKTHPIVMFLIEKDLEKGKKLASESLAIAEKIGDKELQIAFLSHYSDFLIYERKLEEYIKISERCLELDKMLPERSSYYHNTISHLIDAYIYKGGNNDRAIELINELYNSSFRALTYTFYAQLIVGLDENASLKEEILNKFEVENLPDLVTKFLELGENLNPNDYFKLVNMSSKALAAHKFYNEAMIYKDRAINITRKIYSEDLSKSLANYKVAQAVKVKEKEIDNEKEKNKLYAIIAMLAVTFLIISLYIIRKIMKQSKELSEKNIIIKKALKEKELLIKEVHHRVKNNFQIVSSLLELQSQGIENEKALELINEGKNRIKSMALIHQKLYANTDGFVDFADYVHQLTNEIASIYKSEANVIRNIECSNILFDVDTAIPLGLIINELVTNAYKYAFEDNKENTISVIINKQESENYMLIVEDNGKGIPANLDLENSKSIGLRLVKRLVKQLHGSFNFENEKGTKVIIYFKDTNQRKLIKQ